jgi:hypothetical protein
MKRCRKKVAETEKETPREIDRERKDTEIKRHMRQIGKETENIEKQRQTESDRENKLTKIEIERGEEK